MKDTNNINKLKFKKMDILCENCTFKKKRFEKLDSIIKYSSNLGYKENRKIIIPSNNKKQPLKTPWEQTKEKNETGFYCPNCNSLLNIDDMNNPVQKGLKDFIDKYSLNDIRRKYVKSEEFNAEKTAQEILKKYKPTEFKIYDEKETKGKYVDIPKEVNGKIKSILNTKFGIKKLYTHQADAIKEVLKGNDIVIETSTASGKTMAYNIPILQSLLSNPKSRVLYISPTKALAIDQMKTMMQFGNGNIKNANSDAIREFILEDEKHDLVDENIAGVKVTMVKFDSEIKQSTRNKAILNGNIFYSNPDKIHSTILQFNSHKYSDKGKKITWESFFKNLKYVVIDEIHTYRGVFGANVAYVIRRLRRLCEKHGNNNLQFISCTATINNPKELADAITGKDNVLIDNDTSPKKKKKFILLKRVDPKTLESISPVTTTADIVTSFLSKEESIRSITFGNTMQTARGTERIIKDRLRTEYPDTLSQETITFYQGNLADVKRQKIINFFNNKQYHAIVSTIALELGMDMEDVHSVLMIGYPGSTASFRQQAGRAGRKGEGLIITSLFSNPLENYFFNNPKYFFNKPPEKVIVPINNKNIAVSHLFFAEFEGGVTKDDCKFFPENEVEAFISKSDSFENGIINRLYQRSLRSSIGKKLSVMFHDECLAELDINVAKRDIFVGAIFEQPEEDYQVTEVDWKNGIAKVDIVPGKNHLAEYRTQSYSIKTIETFEIIDKQKYPSFQISYEKVNFKNTRINYYKIAKAGNMDKEICQFEDFASPIEFDTKSLKLNLSKSIINKLLKKYSFDQIAGGAAGIENALLSMFVEIVDCDVHDISSITTTQESNHEINIYLYDNFPSGLDFSHQSFNSFIEHLKLVYHLVLNCECKSDEGCPSCIQVHKTYQAIDPNRKIAIEILKSMKIW